MQRDPLTRTLCEFAARPLVVPDVDWQTAATLTVQTIRSVQQRAGTHESDDNPGAAQNSALHLGGRQREATLWISGRSIRAEWAAFGNAFAAYSLVAEQDHNTAQNLPAGTIVVPAAMAAGELTSAPMDRVIDGVLIGLEVTIRVAEGLGSSHANRGWQLAGSAGVLGAAAAAGRLLGLAPASMEQCLGYAATQAAGLTAHAMTPAAALAPAKAALNAVEAARLVRAGLDGPTSILEGRRGLLALATDDPQPERMTDDLGTVWRSIERPDPDISKGAIGFSNRQEAAAFNPASLFT